MSTYNDRLHAREFCSTYGFQDKKWHMREIIKLESTAGTGYFYTTTKNKKTKTDKLEVNKFDPKIRKYVKFVEKKISK